MPELPMIGVGEVRKVFDDGYHNAFTDLCRFRDHLYLTFRSCRDGHGVFLTSSIVVLSSSDGEKWEQVFTFNVPGRDVRDPHFLIFRDRLFIYTGCWMVPRAGEPHNLNDHLGYGVWTHDGSDWHGPVPLEGTYGHYVWRAASWHGRAYLCARRRKAFAPMQSGESHPEQIEAALLESEDGLVWRYKALFTEDYGDETAFVFEADGSILAVARGSGPKPARLCCGKPPYREWIRTELDRNIGGPLLARWEGNCLVGGRNTSSPRGPFTALYWLIDGELHEAAKLPSGGDNSYPGFVPLEEGKGLLSYYSSHEGGTSIYLAKLHLS